MSYLKGWLRTGVAHKLLIITVIGLFIRYFVGILFTYPTDINYWVLVTENFISREDLFGLPGYYYTPVWGYFMSVITAIGGFTGIPLGEYIPELVGGSMIMDWKITMPSLSYALLIKSFLFLFDFLVALVLYRIGKLVFDEKRAVWMYAVWFLCPFTIIISSIRVMFENLEILFLLLSLLMMLERRPMLAGVMMSLSMMTKPYGMFMGVLLLGYSYAQSRSVKYSATYLASVVLTGLLLMVPVIMSGEIQESMIWLSSRAGSGGSGYNFTLYILPFLLVMSFITSIVIAWRGSTSFGLLIGAGAIITSGMLVIPGNIQYYLLLLPFILLLESRWIYVSLFMFLFISVCSFISYSTWSSILYVHGGYWGSGILDSFVDFLYPIDSTIAYDKFKTVTAITVMLAPALSYLGSVRND